MTGSATISVAVPRSAASSLWRATPRQRLVASVSSVLQRGAQSGHTVAVTREERFHALFDRHHPAVARFLRTQDHGSSEAEDVIAATFKIARKRIDNLPEGRAALPWLLGVARNLSRNVERKANREALFVNELSAVMLPWTEMPIEDREASAEVMAALAQLGPLDRDLILLVVRDELTPAEAGQLLGLRPVTARSRLHRARGRMRDLLTRPGASASRSRANVSPRCRSPQEDGRAH